MTAEAQKKRVQTRRSISISVPIYDKLSAYCEVNKVSRSSVIEKVVNGFFDRKVSQ